MTVATEIPTRLDLGCGQSKREGYFGVDIVDTADTDRVVDLLVFPWPFDTDTVEDVVCSHFVEHVPHWRPWFPYNVDGLILFMNELHRVCKDGAKVEIIHPYAQSKRAFQDPTHERYINEITWWYFNREWREQTSLDHYPITADFEIGMFGNSWHPPLQGDAGWELRSDLARGRAADRDWNVIADLVVNLKALK